MLDMEVIVRRQNQEHCASITCMIRHYVARRAKVIEDHPHNADVRASPKRILMHSLAYSMQGLTATMIAELVCVISLQKRAERRI
jgi:hypothetical protein